MNDSLTGSRPSDLADYLRQGGGRGLERARSIGAAAVLGEIEASGLRGRGGAGFPTALKWRATRTEGSGRRYVVCNGAEGEPATYKDRTLLGENPYQVLEGLCIAAFAVGADAAFIVLKETFETEILAVDRAIVEMREAGFTDAPLTLVLGPDLYLLGEETGLLETVEGQLPLPRTTRPFMRGLFARPDSYNPTAVNNVETLANVPHILADGADWLRAEGTPSSPGTMLFTLAGDVAVEGVFELPLGTPLSFLIESVGGGTRSGEPVKAVFPGASAAVVTPAVLDVPLDFESMRAIGSGLGAGGFAVYDETACMVQAAERFSRFLWVESCGQCPACKLGSGRITDLLQHLEAGGTPADVSRILSTSRKVTDGQRCALPTGESLVVQSVCLSFPEEFRAHVGTPCPYERQLTLPKIVDYDARGGRFLYDESYAAKQADWTYEPTARGA